MKKRLDLFSFNKEDFKIDFKENKLFITFNINKISSSEIISRVMKKITVVDFAVKETSIEDIVKKMYKNEV